MDALLYLAKEGKVSGPFDAQKVESMKQSGDFYTYEWMWDGKSPDWAPVPRKLSSPPNLPAEATKTVTKVAAPTPAATVAKTAAHPAATSPTVAIAAAQPARQSRFQGVEIKASSKTFFAVIFDNRQAIGGEVTQAHSRGAHFVSTPSQTVPLSKGTRASVDLLDETTDRSTKIPSTIESVTRMGDRWVLELAWDACPLLDDSK